MWSSEVKGRARVELSMRRETKEARSSVFGPLTRSEFFGFLGNQRDF